MIERKTISLNDMKYYYDNRHGIVFHPQNDNSVETFANMLIKVGATQVQPEFISHINGHTFIVYPEHIEFASGPVFQFSKQIEMMMPIGKLDILSAWLKEH